TRDVAPFAIVAGAPARTLRARFSAPIVERITRLGWWDWPDARLFEAVPDMQTLGIEAFLDKWEPLSRA
ncbi:MAG: antibiotic acetyltransferase, partial [Nitratireductor sp.]